MSDLPRMDTVTGETHTNVQDVDQAARQATCGPSVPTHATVSQCIDWFSEGESKTVEVAGVRVTIRFVGRKGRRGRISITAPAGRRVSFGRRKPGVRSAESAVPHLTFLFSSSHV